MPHLPHLPPTPRKGEIVCPGCGDLASRVSRKLSDRLLNLLNPVKRYHCQYCNWTGTIVTAEARAR